MTPARKRPAKAARKPARPSGPPRWCVVYRRGSERRRWLLVDEVPAGTKRADVLAALEAWRQWQRFAVVPPGVQLAVLPEPRWGELEGEWAGRVSWPELAPTSRRITLEVPGEVWARCTMAARRAGKPSLQAWALEWLAEAAETDG